MDETEEGFLTRPDITDRLPRYRLIRTLADTSASEVFLALDTESGEQVALKVVGPGLREQHDRHDRFARESAIALRMSHPHVVPVHAAGESVDGELGYLAMRYVDGPNLLRLVNAEGRLGLTRTIGLVRQVADALDAAHAGGLVHRDVKPGNILVEGEHAYLSDFGIARDVALTTVTAPQAFVGTLAYSAPEQVDGGEVDHRADIYALGCVVHHCLLGHPPANGDVRGLRPFVDTPVRRVLLTAMAVRPQDRYDSCAEFADALADAATTRARRRTSTVALAALVLVAALVYVVVTVVRQPPLDVAHVPVALREDCAPETPQPGAVSTLSCRAVVSSLFADTTAVDTAFTAAVTRAGVPPSQGDCYAGAAGEHRYPPTGPARGRVLCHPDGDTAVIVWTDDRTVHQARGPDLATLATSWATWTGTAPPTFPTDDERALLDVAAGTECARESLDLVPKAVAGVRCRPTGIGAREVSYYRYVDVDALRADIAGRAGAVSAPEGAPCATGLLGTERHSWRGIDLGQVVCHPTEDGRQAMEWTTEPLSVLGRVTGDVPDAVRGWWNQWRVAPLSRIVEQVNARSGFPTDAERELLRHIPEVSRVACVRANPDLKWQDVGGIPATAVACGPTAGAELVAYYRFDSAETLKSAFLPQPDRHVDAEGRVESCHVDTDEFNAESGYDKAGTRGRLRCSHDKDTGERSLRWTDDQRLIMVSARRGATALAMIDWWTHDAGPV